MEETVGFYTQEHATIYGRNVWHYLVDTPVGHYHIVQYEGKNMEIEEKVFPHNNSKAERAFKKICNDILNGKLI